MFIFVYLLFTFVTNLLLLFFSPHAPVADAGNVIVPGGETGLFFPYNGSCTVCAIQTIARTAFVMKSLYLCLVRITVIIIDSAQQHTGILVGINVLVIKLKASSLAVTFHWCLH